VEKGRTICPNCKKEVILDISSKLKKFKTVCPFCNNSFFVQAKTDDIKSKDECLWIEHGEPRKTVLSCKRVKTKRPKIAGILLICVLIIGLTTVIFSEQFIVSSLNIASFAGYTGSVRLKVIDLSNNSIENVNIRIDGLTGYTNKDGVFIADNISLGIKTIEVSAEGYKNQSFKKLVTPIFNFETIIKLRQGVGFEEKFEYNSLACSMILIIFLVFTFFAAIACLKHKFLDIAIFGSFFSIFTFGFYFIGSILSIIAFILVYKSMEEFENGEKGKIF
jgi:hypothetical protein